MVKRDKALRSFWLTNALLPDIVKLQKERGDERAAHTIRFLLREALAARRLAEQVSGL